MNVSGKCSIISIFSDHPPSLKDIIYAFIVRDSVSTEPTAQLLLKRSIGSLTYTRRQGRVKLTTSLQIMSLSVQPFIANCSHQKLQYPSYKVWRPTLLEHTVNWVTGKPRAVVYVTTLSDPNFSRIRHTIAGKCLGLELISSAYSHLHLPGFCLPGTQF